MGEMKNQGVRTNVSSQNKKSEHEQQGQRESSSAKVVIQFNFKMGPASVEEGTEANWR